MRFTSAPVYVPALTGNVVLLDCCNSTALAKRMLEGPYANAPVASQRSNDNQSRLCRKSVLTIIK
jgi:hypothetical protein